MFVSPTKAAKFVGELHSCQTFANYLRNGTGSEDAETPPDAEGAPGSGSAPSNPIDFALEASGRRMEESVKSALKASGFRHVKPDALLQKSQRQCAKRFGAEVPIEGQIGECKLKGRIDFLLVMDNGKETTMRIIECKSAKSVRRPHLLQLAIYRFLLMRQMEDGKGLFASLDQTKIKVESILKTRNVLPSLLGRPLVDICKEIPLEERRLLTGKVIEDLCSRLPFDLQPLGESAAPSASPPVRLMGSHCASCEFSSQCWSGAAQEGDLSLVGCSPAEAAVLRERGKIRDIEDLSSVPSVESLVRLVNQKGGDPAGIRPSRLETLHTAAIVCRGRQKRVEREEERGDAILRRGGGHQLSGLPVGSSFPFLHIFLYVSRDGVSNRLAGLSACVRAGWNDREPVCVVKMAEGPFVSLDDRLSPEGEIEGANEKERSCMEGFASTLFETLKVKGTQVCGAGSVGGAGNVYLHVSVHSESDVRFVLDRAQAVGADGVAWLVWILSRRDGLPGEALCVSSLENEMKRFDRKWHGSHLVVASRLRWGGGFGVFCWDVQSEEGEKSGDEKEMCVNLDVLFRTDLFDVFEKEKGEKGDRIERQVKPMPASSAIPPAYLYAYWNALPQGKHASRLAAYTAAGPFVPDLLKRMAQALAWVADGMRRVEMICKSNVSRIESCGMKGQWGGLPHERVSSDICLLSVSLPFLEGVKSLGRLRGPLVSSVFEVAALQRAGEVRGWVEDLTTESVHELSENGQVMVIEDLKDVSRPRKGGKEYAWSEAEAGVILPSVAFRSSVRWPKERVQSFFGIENASSVRLVPAPFDLSAPLSRDALLKGSVNATVVQFGFSEQRGKVVVFLGHDFMVRPDLSGGENAGMVGNPEGLTVSKVFRSGTGGARLVVCPSPNVSGWVARQVVTRLKEVSALIDKEGETEGATGHKGGFLGCLKPLHRESRERELANGSMNGERVLSNGRRENGGSLEVGPGREEGGRLQSSALFSTPSPSLNPGVKSAEAPAHFSSAASGGPSSQPKAKRAHLLRLLPDQRRAVEAFADPRTELLLLHGPPGTGKTETMAVSLLEYLLERKGKEKPCTVLLSGPTHAAVDVLMARVVKRAVESCEWFSVASEAKGGDGRVSDNRGKQGKNGGIGRSGPLEMAIVRVGAREGKGGEGGAIEGVKIFDVVGKAPSSASVLLVCGTVTALLKETTWSSSAAVRDRLRDAEALFLDEASMAPFSHLLALWSLPQRAAQKGGGASSAVLKEMISQDLQSKTNMKIFLGGDHRQLRNITPEGLETEIRPSLTHHRAFLSAYEYVRESLSLQSGEHDQPEGGVLAARHVALSVTLRLPRVLRWLVSPAYQLDGISLQGGPGQGRSEKARVSPSVGGGLRDLFSLAWGQGEEGEGVGVLSLLVHSGEGAHKENEVETEIFKRLVTASGLPAGLCMQKHCKQKHMGEAGGWDEGVGCSTEGRGDVNAAGVSGGICGPAVGSLSNSEEKEEEQGAERETVAVITPHRRQKRALEMALDWVEGSGGEGGEGREFETGQRNDVGNGGQGWEVRDEREQGQVIDRKSVISVDTVERMQGGEADSVIFCMTVSDVEKARNKAGEFYKNLNRTNVAFSRAKRRLIVVCAQSILQMMPESGAEWEEMLQWRQLRLLWDAAAAKDSGSCREVREASGMRPADLGETTVHTQNGIVASVRLVSLYPDELAAI
uniref:DNA2/NAM7 helicase-like C-terminal domain-containing protein n=1 Tax=Chromera velia CCMP2878 TaxID=1169474 RepID=A0A0G4H0S1_9ALVE|eukprot:Cvel_24241.t1-p1 / transcript=Cvel_24241.t1 / gene=Cvel_24241 / organism=Chromera_velia_CCMP2878 / gene_product=hypothetical protein / transcript_product=hypothetical protein / location=Cvel_scaffold2595:17438-23626(-) / protein_length=1698 / sequence_SO=supercontig / SO=protein_coding / is_pseudo=false